MDMVEKERTIFRNRHLYDPNKIDQNKRYVNRYGKILTVLHHFDQKHKGAWVVLENKFHQRHHGKLHSSTQPSYGVNRKIFDYEREAFWRMEYNDILNSMKECPSSRFR